VPAVKHISAKSDVVTTLKRVGDWAAIKAVFCAAFQVGIKNIHTVFAKVAIEAPVTVFRMEEVVAEAVFVIDLMYEDSWGLQLYFVDFSLNFFRRKFGDFPKVFFFGIRFIEDVVFFPP